MNMTFKELSEKIDKSDGNRAYIDIESVVYDLFDENYYYLSHIDDEDCDRITCYYFGIDFYKMYFLDDVPVAIGIPEYYRDDINYCIKWFNYEAKKSVMQYLDSVAYTIRDKRDAKDRLNQYLYSKDYINLDSNVDESIENLVNKD